MAIAIDEFDLASHATIEFVALAIGEKGVFANLLGILNPGNVIGILDGECLPPLSSPTGRINTAAEFQKALEVIGFLPMLDR